ncbi:MAG: hypothetical protein K6G12_03110 [Lachnospiraceae bacterium]|nr:hypothetical protein [Lachnospiraceae bacterium]
MIKSIEQTEQRINEVISDRKKDIAEREAQLEESRKALSEAEDNISKAIETDNAELYRKAKKEKADAEDDIELREKRLELLKKQPLIDQSEYNKRCQAIFTDLDAMTVRQQTEIVKIVDQLKAIYDEANESIIKGNEILERWQREVYRNADRSKSPEGKIMKLSHETMHYNNFNVTTFIRNLLEDGYYQGFLNAQRGN